MKERKTKVEKRSRILEENSHDKLSKHLGKDNQ